MLHANEQMVINDPFGIQSELKIAKSGVRQIFTPHQPIKQKDLFFGRNKEVSSIIEYLNTPGQHALLFGNRGVGKSSLANVASDLIFSGLGLQIVKKRCDSHDTFLTIVGKILLEVGIDVSEISNSHTKTKGVQKVLNFAATKTTQKVGSFELADSPSWVAEQISHLSAIFVVDEFDAIQNSKEKNKIAELIKQLSDEGSNLKFFLVGIAESSTDLTAGHPSVSRCLREVNLANMSKDELKDILYSGAKKLKKGFEPKVIDKIINLSSGYPHFTHLLGLKSAEEAIIEERDIITIQDLHRALGKSINDVEGTLRESYDRAVRSTSLEYKRILLAVAVCPGDEIKAKQIREKYEELYEEKVSQGHLNNFFQRLVSNDHSAVLRRIGKGVYKFSDPRMPSFIRIAQSHIS